MTRFIRAIAIAALSAVPSRALACAVCFVGREQSTVAFFGTAALLTVLPFALFGGIALWLRGKLRAVPPPSEPLDPPRA